MTFSPLMREQILARCDLAGLARVVAVGRASLDSPNLAKLAFLRVVKGAPPERDGLVCVRLHGGTGRDGGHGWSDWWDYPVGALVMTHLEWNGADQVYETAWPGAVVEVEGAVARVA